MGVGSVQRVTLRPLCSSFTWAAGPGPTASRRGLAMRFRPHLLPRHAQEVGLCDLVVEDDQYGWPHAVVVGWPVR